MRYRYNNLRSISILLALVGVHLTGVALFAPHEGSNEGKSFLEVALNSQWASLGDWAAAWCSLKIILLSFGAFFLIVAIEGGLELLQTETLAKAMSFLIPLPGVSFCLGSYFFARALF